MSDSTELSPTKRALLALQQMQAKLEAVESAQRQPIAIVGMACRLPGAENLRAFWRLLATGRDAIGPVPSDRWDLEKYYDPDGSTPGKMPHREGGFLPDLLGFDAGFFRIAPREAVSLDPQQRLLLEVSWEALEQGGWAADRMVGSNTGVFIGISSIDYWQRLLGRPDSEIDAYLATGNTHSMAAGRLSYVLGLTGPSLAIDTACSSSLVAVHQACQSLRAGECDLALAGGVNRILEPATSLNFAKARMLSPTDRCRSFDAGADGFVRAEGCGVVVLKRWREAVRDGDPIWGVILGSAVNHDGRASGLTVPNGVAQQALIRQALGQSGVEPDQVSYVETHGTGTALGDPIEVNALGEVFGNRGRNQALILGAVKTNIGHPEAAAGIAGLIKTVLALHHAQIPANLHFQTPNPQIDWSLPVRVPTTTLPWPSSDQARIAGVSAFGFSGTNAHLVLADRPLDEALPVLPLHPDTGPVLLPLSAKTEAALKQLVERYCKFLAEHQGINPSELCYTAQVGRSHWNYRLAILANSQEDLQAKLVRIVSGGTGADVWQGRAAAGWVENEAVSGDLPEVARRYVAGANFDWATLYSQRLRRISLPSYPFQRQRYGEGRWGDGGDGG
ncbi:MAG: beta-ketoacyl synthase N-terminal-like domain-containing protein [Nodosilinea sp.]